MISFVRVIRSVGLFSAQDFEPLIHGLPPLYCLFYKIVGKEEENIDSYDFNWFLAIVPPNINFLLKPTSGYFYLQCKTPSLDGIHHCYPEK